MTNTLINIAAFAAALATVVFERFIQPSLELSYRYLMSELGGEPVLVPAVAMPVAVAPVEAKTVAEPKPTTRRRTTRNKAAAPKTTPGVGF